MRVQYILGYIHYRVQLVECRLELLVKIRYWGCTRPLGTPLT